MGMTGRPEAIDALKGFLQNEDVWLKGTAVIALGNMADRCRENTAVVGRVVEILEQYKEDSNPQIKKNTRMVLDRLKNRQQ